MYRYLTINRINQIAWKVLQKSKVETPPVNVEKIASYLGVEIKEGDFGDDICGLLIKKDGKVIIGLDKQNNKHQNRKRFTIAHELGHYVLEHERKGLFVDKSKQQFSVFFRDSLSTEGTNQQEIEANAFAAALLMPKNFVEQEIKKLLNTGEGFDLSGGDDTFINQLAKSFKVSKMAMTYRMGNLNLFNTM